VDENGNDFHYQVADFFETKGWSVNRSPYYIDLRTQKSREIDIIAQKKWPVIEKFRQKSAGILVRLFIECKWILPSVSLHFNFIDNNKDLAERLARNNNILRERNHPPPLTDMSKDPPRIHHYLQQNEVARNCACVLSKGGNKDIFYEAWDQALHALIYYKNQLQQQRWVPVDVDFNDEPIYTIDYPVVVFNSFNTFHKRDWNSQTSTPMMDNFLWSVEYSYSETSRNQEQIRRREDFLVDITSFPTLENFLVHLERNDIEICHDRVWYRLRR
jgi:hypothetical protein